MNHTYDLDFSKFKKGFLFGILLFNDKEKLEKETFAKITYDIDNIIPGKKLTNMKFIIRRVSNYKI